MTSESAGMSLNPLKYPLMTGSIRVNFENFNSLPRRTATHRLRPTFQGFFWRAALRGVDIDQPSLPYQQLPVHAFSLFTMMQSQVYFKHPTDRRS